MEYNSLCKLDTSMLAVFLFLVANLVVVQTRWQTNLTPNFVSRKAAEQLSEAQVFEGLLDEDDGFKLLLVEDDKAFIGAKNRVYYMSLKDTKNISTLIWEESFNARGSCTNKGHKRGKESCANFIRVVVRKSEDQLYVCGTNAFQPKCRYYNMEKNGHFVMDSESDGRGICPYDPDHNSTVVYTDGKIFSATVSDLQSRDPLILRTLIPSTSSDRQIRTRQNDNLYLNEPNFVSSYDKDDKVLIFFRETAMENVNCGKMVFSRVGRVCKKDEGHERQKEFTSFFKARLNCSIPGDFPFDFNEIQATSSFGQGNYKPTSDSGDRHDMIYGVFNTPENSIAGSAVCAYRYSDIVDVFRGRFKGQETVRHNWEPVRWEETPTPHPQECEKSDHGLSYDSLGFIKKHPLMNEAVPALGKMPMLVHTSFKTKFTSIAIDWQRRAADGNYYDVIYVGTNDGRVIKSINKEKSGSVQSVVIEDIQVLDQDEPVVNLKVLSKSSENLEKLVIISKRKIVSIPLHRCNRSKSCSACVALQDPYCVWEEDLKKCYSGEIGIQSILTGKNDKCGAEKPEKEAIKVTTVPSEIPSCVCAHGKINNPENLELKVPNVQPRQNTLNNARKEELEQEKETEGYAEASHTAQASGTTIEILVIAVIIAVVFSLPLGFFIGYKFQSCRHSRDRDSVFYDQKCSSLQRPRKNRLSSGDNPYFHTDHTNLTPKQCNYVVNVKSSKTNSGAETKPVTKSNKVYL